MSKFKRVLSDYDLRVLLGAGLILDKRSVNHVRDIEQAVLAKLAEQEPVATVSQETFSNDGTSDIITCNLPTGIKLYTHPIPTIKQEPIAYLYDDEVYGNASGAISDYIRQHGQPLYADPVAPKYEEEIE